jgi:LysR family transcriptional regulator, nitrogen assimilation regulatory protein
MNLAAWRIFLDAAELGSLGKVALLHGSSQPQVSRQINTLEQRCGGRLFSRTGRGVQLTDLGMRIAPKVREWIANTEALESDIQGSAHQPMGRVRLGIIPSVAHPLTSTLLRAIQQKHPLIQIRVQEGQGAQLEHWLHEGALDMALAETDTYLVGRPGCPLTAAPTVRFSKLKGLPLVTFCRPSSWRDQLDHLARERGFDLQVQLEADSLAVQIALAAQGPMYALLGGYAIGEALAQGQVQASRVVEPRVTRHVSLALSRTGEVNLAMRTVIEEAKQLSKTLTGSRAIK